jgi:hypothetical protein
MGEMTRRRFLARVSLVPLLALLPRRILLDALADASEFRFFTAHQAAVVREATARLIPGPQDDPAETGHPGAREANVVRFIDTLLAAFDVEPPKVHAGGPWSDRSGGTRNFMKDFLPLPPAKARAWRKRVAALQKTYRDGIALLDQQAGGDFATAPALMQDQILASPDAGEFRDVLFTNAIEGMYSVPEYGGNAGLVGWQEIKFRGDTQPRGYSPAQVSQSDGPDPVDPTGIVGLALGRFDAAIPLLARMMRGGR